MENLEQEEKKAGILNLPSRAESECILHYSRGEQHKVHERSEQLKIDFALNSGLNDF